ncbi:MAG TPA: IS200/IS605 family transposase [Candidatus Kapabacteria bacterium]|nr:IS200/IS605 family transposase [Candidatus Kapabacteria bacterium]
MASTFSNILLHYIFAPKHRENRLRDDFRDELHRYIHGILNNTKNKQLAIGSVEDHMHLFVSMHPTESPANLIKLVKGNSSRFINEKGFVKRPFEWQEGYGVFSHSASEKERVMFYVEHQKEHHAKQPFRVEFIGILGKVGIIYNEKYLFDWMKDVDAGLVISSLRDSERVLRPSSGD